MSSAERQHNHSHDHSHAHGHAHGHGGGCDHARDRAGAAREAIEAAEAACTARGARLTPIRRRVLETLFSTHKPLGAYEVAGALGERDGRYVAPITVYRALDFLMGQGFVHRLESRNAFVACPHAHGEEDLIVFLICETCGGVDETSPAAVRKALDAVAREAGFAPRARVIEVAGTCSHCRTA